MLCSKFVLYSATGSLQNFKKMNITKIKNKLAKVTISAALLLDAARPVSQSFLALIMEAGSAVP